jgi:hypothetical protein
MLPRSASCVATKTIDVSVARGLRAARQRAARGIGLIADQLIPQMIEAIEEKSHVDASL